MYLFIRRSKRIDDCLAQPLDLVKIHALTDLTNAEKRKDMLPVGTRSLSLLNECLDKR